MRHILIGIMSLIIAAPHHHHHHHHHRHHRKPIGQLVVSYARRYLGYRYSWGGDSPGTGFDCSGFVRYVYGHFGVNLSHSTYAQADAGRPVRGRLREGDIVFFFGYEHVGIYVGGGRFINAPHSGSTVQIDPMWSGYDGGRRLLVG